MRPRIGFAKLLLWIGMLLVPATSFAQRRAPDPFAADTPLPAIEYSDAYYTRLAIHRTASYAIIPLFAAQYYLGSQLISSTDVPPDWVKPTHLVVASSVGALFAVNTVTGVWNLIESRHEPEGRTRRIIHAAFMLAADAGFAYTGILAGDASGASDASRKHRDVALTSMALSTTGAILMWVWNR